MNQEEVKEKYNKDILDKFKSDYEYNRWFKNPILKAGYDMTKNTIENLLLSEKLHFQNYLELGPGAGTWTKPFLEKNSHAQFDLVDISREMLSLAKEALSKYKNVNYFESDFLQFGSQKKYDFFFSSRVIEYFTHKDSFTEKLSSLMVAGGTCFLITKTPKYLRYKLLDRKIVNFHQNQIQPKDLKKVLEKNGFSEFEFYPVTMYFPGMKSASLNRLVYKIFHRFRLNFLSQFFSESYSVKFKKI